MAENYIKKIRTNEGDKQIDYNALANTPFHEEIISEEDTSVTLKFNVTKITEHDDCYVAYATYKADSLGLILGQTYGMKLKGYKGEELILERDILPNEEDKKDNPNLDVVHKDLFGIPSFVHYADEDYFDYDEQDINISLEDFSSADFYEYAKESDIEKIYARGYMEVNTSIFVGDCDSYELILTGNFSYVKVYPIAKRYLGDESVGYSQLSWLAVRKIQMGIEEGDVPDIIARVAYVDEKIDDARIKPTSQGSMHALSDSAEAPIPSMRIFGKTKQATTTGKNKLPYVPQSKTTLNNGITFVENGDGTITVSGTATANATYVFVPTSKAFALTTGTQYTLRGCPSGGSMDTYRLSIQTTDYLANYDDVGNGNTFTATDKACYAFVMIKAGVTVNNLTFYPIIVEGSTYDGNWEPYTGGMPSPNPSYPQALESVGDDGSVEQFVCGKNLLKYPYARTTMTTNGITFTDNGDGSVTVNGTSTGFSIMELAKSFNFIHGMRYRLSGSSLNVIFISYIDKTGVTRFYSNTASSDFVWDNAYTFKTVYAQYSTAQGTVNETIYPMLYCVGYDNTYEPPKQSQSLTIPTPNGLPGIPVSSGGNYTDENGQQWISDEIDLEREVKVQRIWSVTIDKNSPIIRQAQGKGYRFYVNSLGLFPPCLNLNNATAKTLCTHLTYDLSPIGDCTKESISSYKTGNIYFVMNDFTTVEELKVWLADNPMQVAYPLAEPIETPLSEEEIAAYKALHTNYPNTTIYNDEGAYTEVKYVADTKNYVDNKIANEVAKLTAAIITE